MAKKVVEVKNLTKSFKIPLESSNGLKQKLINQLKGRKGYRDFSPLQDISFHIEEGDFFGIVGRNGSGKSTLLKTLAGIYTPNEGVVKVSGTLVPFIELGVGFNPELTGRENVFLNGALLGFSRNQMEEMYDDIVEFAELHDFMEERLKNYSSGMQVRLAFSIAIRAEGDILLLDEVLAVGDEAFQRKCYAYFSKLKRMNKTVILVTHDMGAVQRFCNKAMFIQDGKIEYIGSTDEAATLYTKENDDAYAQSIEKESKQEKATDKKQSKMKLKITNGIGTKVKRFYEDQDIELHIEWPYANVSHVGVALIDGAGRDVFSPNTFKDKRSNLVKNGITYKVKASIRPGEYFFKVSLFGKHDKDVIDRELEGPSFIIEKDKLISEYVGVARLEYSWLEG
jgi:ABC-2 type transport system ATP-binding protein